MQSIALLAGMWFAAAPIPADVRIEKPGYRELAQLLHKQLLDRAPKQVEDQSDWGKTIPPPERLRLPRLRRTWVRVGDHMELPHGLWKKSRFWLADPEHGLRIVVLDLYRQENEQIRMRFQLDLDICAEGEWEQWLNGLRLLNVSARADVAVSVVVDCDVTTTLNLAKFPPIVETNPQVAGIRLALRDLQIRRIGPVILDETRLVSEELRQLVEALMRTQEGPMRDQANAMIAEATRKQKLTMPPSLLVKLGVPPKGSSTSRR